jgi:hypothetical protein
MFVSLPAEVIDLILGHLRGIDLGSVRATCRSLAALATPPLFSRISISKLHRDRTSFLHIAATPQLAALVRTVEWLELAGSATALNIFYHPDPECLPEGPEPPECEVSEDYPPTISWPALPEEENALYLDLYHQAKALFWLHIPQRDPWPLFGYEEEQEEQMDAAIADFLPQFIAALKCLPNLTTLASRPMHPFRQLQSSAEGYPFTAQLFHVRTRTLPVIYNYGYFYFLQPAMHALVTKGGPVISRLYHADEAVKAIGVFPGTTSQASDAFKNLTHLDLCMVSPANGQIYRTEPWVAVGGAIRTGLEMAPSLTHLRLCFERRVPSIRGGLDGSFLEKYLPTMPNLVSLDMDSVPFTFDVLTDLLARHDKTLRQVNIKVDLDYPNLLGESELRQILGLEKVTLVVDLDEEGPTPLTADALELLVADTSFESFEPDVDSSSDEDSDYEDMEMLDEEITWLKEHTAS